MGCRNCGEGSVGRRATRGTVRESEPGCGAGKVGDGSSVGGSVGVDRVEAGARLELGPAWPGLAPAAGLIRGIGRVASVSGTGGSARADAVSMSGRTAWAAGVSGRTGATVGVNRGSAPA